MNESRLVFDIMRELGKHGAVYRCNSGSVKLPSVKRFNGMPKGFADVMFIRSDGVACFVECKTDKGKLSDEQERFIAPMQALNAKAGTARFSWINHFLLSTEFLFNTFLNLNIS